MDNRYKKDKHDNMDNKYKRYKRDNLRSVDHRLRQIHYITSSLTNLKCCSINIQNAGNN
jgi:hypothetical protein